MHYSKTQYEVYWVTGSKWLSLNGLADFQFPKYAIFGNKQYSEGAVNREVFFFF